MMATANPVAGAQEPMVVSVPPGVSAGQMIQINANGQMMNVQVPAGLSQGMQFQVMVPAPVQVAQAVPVAAPMVTPMATPVQHSQPQRGGQSDDEPVQAYTPIGMDDPVVQAKIVRSVELDRKTTDAGWAALFLVSLVACNFLGFYEINNAMDVANQRSEKLAAEHEEGNMNLWCGHESSSSGSKYHCEIRSLLGPSTTGRAIKLGARQTTKTCDADFTSWKQPTNADFCYMPKDQQPTQKVGKWSLGKCPVSQAPPPPSPSTGTGGNAGSGRRRVLQSYSSSRRSSRHKQHEPVPPDWVDHEGEEVEFDTGTQTSEQTDLGVTWADADEACKGLGARICTLDELGKAQNSGCGSASSQPWALDACDGGHLVIGELGKVTCVADCALRPIRCCAHKSANHAKAAEKQSETVNNVTVIDEDHEEKVDVSGVVSPTLTALFVALVLGVLSGIAYIQGLRAHPRCLTWFANLLFPSLLLLVALMMLGTGVLFLPGLLMLIFALIMFAMVWCWRAQLELTAQLLKISTHALTDNTGLIGTNVLLQIIQCIIEIPVLVYYIAAYYQTATWSPLPEVTGCAEVSQFQFEASPTRFFHGFMIIWIGMLLMEMVVHNVGATVAIWYFHKGDANYAYPASPAMTTLGWTFGSGFGSMCMASFILTVVRIIVAMIEQAERNAREEGGAAQFLMCILACVARYLEAWIQFITKLSVITVAITNQEFWPACKQTFGLLMRNYLDGVMIDNFAKMTLQFFAMLVALIMGILGYVMVGVMLPDDMKTLTVQLIIAALVLVAVYCVLILLADTVLVIINTLYMAYIIDKDNNFAPSEMTAHIHQLYEQAIDGSIQRMQDKGGSKLEKSGPGRRAAERGGVIM